MGITGKKTGTADWLAIAAVKQRLSIPVIANGNIERFDDIERCLLATGADAVRPSFDLLCFHHADYVAGSFTTILRPK
jgi:imidazole glycerol phosphate synthase subunit HisF